MRHCLRQYLRDGATFSLLERDQATLSHIFINQNIRIMNNVRFIPGQYEWHLVDEKDNILLNIPDGIIDDCETKADLDFVIGDIPRQALQAVEEGEELYGCDVRKYVSDIDDDCVTKLMADTLSEYLGLTA